MNGRQRSRHFRLRQKSFGGKPTCRGCGACCRNQPSPPFLDWDSFKRRFPKLAMEIVWREIETNYDDSLPCLWLTPEGRCKHYEIRPQICREFRLGGEHCVHNRQVYQIGGVG